MTFGADIHGTQRRNHNDFVDASIATSTRWIETSVFPGETGNMEICQNQKLVS